MKYNYVRIHYPKRAPLSVRLVTRCSLLKWNKNKYLDHGGPLWKPTRQAMNRNNNNKTMRVLICLSPPFVNILLCEDFIESIKTDSSFLATAGHTSHCAMVMVKQPGRSQQGAGNVMKGGPCRNSLIPCDSQSYGENQCHE